MFIIFIKMYIVDDNFIIIIILYVNFFSLKYEYTHTH